MKYMVSNKKDKINRAQPVLVRDTGSKLAKHVCEVRDCEGLMATGRLCYKGSRFRQRQTP